MSTTPERTVAPATAAADTLQRNNSVAKNLFFGDILEENLFPYPHLRAKDKEILGAMVDAIDDFLSPRHKELAKYDRAGAQPPEYVQALRDMGLFGLIIGEEYGGLGLSNGGYARVGALVATGLHMFVWSRVDGTRSSVER